MGLPSRREPDCSVVRKLFGKVGKAFNNESKAARSAKFGKYFKILGNMEIPSAYLSC